MSEPLARHHDSLNEPPKDFAWVEAFMTLVHVMTDDHFAAAPAKCLGGALLVVKLKLAEKLGVSLRQLDQLITDDRSRFYDQKDATIWANRAVEPI